MHETREYGRGDECVVGEFVLAYLSYFTDFMCFWQVVVHTYVNFIHTFIRGRPKLWINATPILPPSEYQMCFWLWKTFSRCIVDITNEVVN